MKKYIIFLSLLAAGFVSSAHAQTLSKSFDVDTVGAKATLVGLGNIQVDRNGQFRIGPSDAWSLKSGKLNKAKWNLAVDYLGAGRDKLTSGQSDFDVQSNVVNIEFANSILKYERDGSQIEQIVVVKASPAGTGDLRASFSMSESFSYALDKDGGFTVNDREKTVLKFGALTTFDAKGRILPSHIEITNNVVTYVVEDEGAVYPVTIDPIVSTPSVTIEGQNGGQFGFSFDSLDINGDGFQDLIIGEDRYTNPENVEGRIYLFLGSANGLAATSVWELESDEANARFGAKVRNLGDINGDGNDDFAISAALSSDPVSNAPFVGSVLVFLGDDIAPGAPIWDAYGTSFIGIFGHDIVTGDFNCDGTNDIAISANFHNGTTGMKNGQVNIYNGSNVAPYFANTSSFTANFVSASEAGTALAAGNINGDKGAVSNMDCIDLVVGRPGSNVNGREAGGFDVFLGTESGPSTIPSSSHEGIGAREKAGFSLAAADFNKDGFDDIVVGSYLTNDETDPLNIIVNAGRISIHDGSATGLEAVASVNIFGEAADIGLGYSITLGDFDDNGFVDIAAGAPDKTSTIGMAYVYLNATGSPSTTHAWTTSNGGTDGRFGDTIGAGDFNNDGFSDLVVGAVYFTTDEGSVYIYDGRATCTIGNQVYSSGVVSSNGCGICDTSKSVTDWSPLPTGTECGTAVCSQEGLRSSACDGNLTCSPLPTVDEDCGAYNCDAALDQCFSSCTDNTQCETDATCDNNNVCVSSKPTAVVTGLTTGTCGDTITLSANDSTDPNGLALTFEWAQTNTPDVLSGVDVSGTELTFDAPIVTEDTVLIFSLVAKSPTLISDPALYEVTIIGCPSTGDSADMGMVDTGTADMGVTTDVGGTDTGTLTPDSGTAPDSGGVDDGSLSGGGCGCMSLDKSNPKDSLFLVFVLGLLVLRRKRS